MPHVTGTVVFVLEFQNQDGLAGLADQQLSLYLTASYTSISATVLWVLVIAYYLQCPTSVTSS